MASVSWSLVLTPTSMCKQMKNIPREAEMASDRDRREKGEGESSEAETAQVESHVHPASYQAQPQ